MARIRSRRKRKRIGDVNFRIKYIRKYIHLFIKRYNSNYSYKKHFRKELSVVKNNINYNGNKFNTNN